MAAKKRAKKVEKTQTEEHPPLEEEETSLILVRRVGIIGEKIHAILLSLPNALNVGRKDVVAMHTGIDENARLKSIGYWMFIVASCGIATLGLIINSPAVIIGAMLVSPLMAPIIGLGLGITLGDVYLGAKSLVIVSLSILVAVLTSAFITVIVPINGVTPEIFGRTNPTILDLFIAIFCGLVAALSSVRTEGHKAMADAAPGAAIGVALMPPLCVVGFYLGKGFEWDMMWGAFLLFVTNLTAIVLVSTVFFYFIYDEYSPVKLIQMRAKVRTKSELFYENFQKIWEAFEISFESRKRFLLPVLLLIAISFPLSFSLAFLKLKNDIRSHVTKYLQKIEGIDVTQGPERLIFTRQDVVGNIQYYSPRPPRGDLSKELKDSIAQKFDGFQAKIRFIRLAGDSDISNLLKSQRAARLEVAKNNLGDGERNAHATEIVKRALELLMPRFPEEIGVISDLRVAYSIRGMDRIRVEYRGNPLPPVARKTLELSMRNELRVLKGRVNKVDLVYAGPARGRLGCGSKPNSLATWLRFQKVLGLLVVNPYLKLELVTKPGFIVYVEGTADKKKLHDSKKQIIPGINKAGCLVEFKYRYEI